MSNSHRGRVGCDAAGPGQPPASRPDQGPSGMSKSMHNGVAVWCDCCSCEAEPYWAALAGDTGAEPSGDAVQNDIDDREDSAHHGDESSPARR